MTMFANLRISTKIGALLLMLGVGVLGGVLFQSYEMQRIDHEYAHMVSVRIPNNVELMAGRDAVDRMAYAAYKTMTYDGASAEARKAAQQQAEAAAEYRSRYALVRGREPELAGALDPLIATADRIAGLSGQAVRLGLANRNDEARALLRQVDALEDEFGTSIVALRETRAKEINAESKQLGEDADSTTMMLLVGQIVGVIIAIGAAVLVSRRTISGPLAALGGVMRDLAAGRHDVEIRGTDRRDEVGQMAATVLVFRDALRAQAAAEAEKARENAARQSVIESLSDHLGSLARGDLTRPIAQEYPADYTLLRDNFNAAIESLRALITSVIDSTAAIRSGSGEIQTASEDLARRTESSAASLEQSSAAINQMSERIQAAADSSVQTVKRADQAIATVGSGRATAEEAVEAMRRVSENARGIDSVIEGLDKIAFQTRVLAMNAAVEAGRAGEAGRGFAVVADLVGQLAMRSEEEAKRAREQLTATQADVELTGAAVQKVDEALVAISTDVGSVHELLSQLALDNQAQATTVREITTAIESVDKATQQNAAMVEEVSAAARSLEAEVETLSHRTASFEVGERSSQAAKARRAQSPAHAAPAPVPATRIEAYQSPVKPLPAPAIAALTRDTDDWDEF